jgi:hypothetical protein
MEWVVISFSPFLFHPNNDNSDASIETAERHFIHHLNVRLGSVVKYTTENLKKNC